MTTMTMYGWVSVRRGKWHRLAVPTDDAGMDAAILSRGTLATQCGLAVEPLNVGTDGPSTCDLSSPYVCATCRKRGIS